MRGVDTSRLDARRERKEWTNLFKLRSRDQFLALLLPACALLHTLMSHVRMRDCTGSFPPCVRLPPPLIVCAPYFSAHLATRSVRERSVPSQAAVVQGGRGRVHQTCFYRTRAPIGRRRRPLRSRRLAKPSNEAAVDWHSRSRSAKKTVGKTWCKALVRRAKKDLSGRMLAMREDWVPRESKG